MTEFAARVFVQITGGLCILLAAVTHMAFYPILVFMGVVLLTGFIRYRS